jgi:hypothetical protein
MKKIRGNKKRLRQIENWRVNNLTVDLKYLEKSDNDYVKFRIFPWNPVAMSLYKFPNPKGKIRKKIIESFFDIYDSWNRQLKELGKPYYLKIWLFEPDVYLSQVVCATNGEIDYYENIFFTPEILKNITDSSLENSSERINNYNWDFKIEEHQFFKEDLTVDSFENLKEFKVFKRRFEENHRVITQEIDGEKTKIFLLPRSKVWIGEIKPVANSLQNQLPVFL